MKEKSIAKGKPDLNILFIYNMPFRGMAKMMNGMVSMEMAAGILVMCQRSLLQGPGAGMARLAKPFPHRQGR